MIPDEMKAFVNGVKTAVPEIEKALISVVCSDELQMANANSFAAAITGADQIKTTVVGIAAPSLETVAHTIDRRGDAYAIACGIKTTELQRAVKQISWYAGGEKKNSLFEESSAEASEGIKLTEASDLAEVIKAVKQLGYELSEDDNAKVYEAFKRTA